MTHEQVIQDIQYLYGKLAIRDAKYLRNLNRFLTNGNRREGIRTISTVPPAFYNAMQDDKTGLTPNINVSRSMVLTLLSKLIQTKGRIFFNPINGLWKTIKVCRSAQIYFDAVYESDKIYDKVQRAVLEALVFDIGILGADEETKSIFNVLPHQFYVDPAEFHYKKVSRCYIMDDEFPLISLRDKLDPEKTPISYAKYQNNPFCKVTYYKYWDLVNQKKYTVVDSEFIEDIDIEYTEMPFSFFYYNKPVKGFFSVSLIDNVYSHQKEIDSVMKRIHDAYTLSPANTIYIPKGAGNDSIGKVMNNAVGNIIEYNAQLGQIVVSTPPAIDPSYQGFLSFMMQSAFEQEGISQLSATSKKPTGINSGVALDTLQDVESERFQTQVDNLIQFYKDINNTMINTYPKNDEILPKRLNRASVKWSEIVKSREEISMTSSLATALSKDPKVKMEQIEKLQSQGIIDIYMASSLLELPDLEGAYSAMAAAYDDCRKIIERALDNDEYDFYSVIPLDMLMKVSVNTLLQLDSNDEDPKTLKRLVKLIEIVNGKINEKNQIQNPPMPPMSAQEGMQQQVPPNSQVQGSPLQQPSLSDMQQTVPAVGTPVTTGIPSQEEVMQKIAKERAGQIAKRALS